eukprot:TRINITY_DN6288_c3_g1_i1.p1 TRINITY_DN6288_c3_g1~~TRINITY_DN6288_c3_g1_i1.p1  ORF type:complete len:229 (-),score=35.74 TRINITY_DN6288_c3_g1_i1:151-837(-)
MLQVYKNQVVAGAQCSQADVRQKELDFYTNNYWIWGGTAVIMAGFAFGELTEEIPEGTNDILAMSYLGFTAICLSLDLCIITWTVLICIWGPGMALRGPDGMKSFHDAVDFLKNEQSQIYTAFVVSVIAYFGSSCCLLWVYPSTDLVNTAGTCVLLLCLVALTFVQCRLDFAIGALGNAHEDVDGQIHAFRTFEHISDLDAGLAAAVTKDVLPAHATATTFQRGMYEE